MTDSSKTSKSASRKTQLVILTTILAVLAAGAIYLYAKALFDPDIPFLAKSTQAEWIQYPLKTDTALREGFFINLPVTFTKTFRLTQKPLKTTFYIKAFKTCQLWINQTKVFETNEKTNWKKQKIIDITDLLKPGTNTISIEAKCKYGPACVCGFTEGLPEDFATDNSWTADIPDYPALTAAIADDTIVPPISKKTSRPIETFLKKSPTLALLLLIASAICWLSLRTQKKAESPPNFFLHFLRPAPKTALVIAIILWTILFINNWTKIPLSVGFDAETHFEYITHLQQHHTLPDATKGWEYHQPPLFYVLSAAILSLAKTIFTAETAELSLRLLPFIGGIGHIVLVYFAAKLLFPNRHFLQSAAVAFSAIVPMNIYISTNFSNESFAAFLMGLALLLTLKILHKKTIGFRELALLALTLGLAILTKLTSIILIPVICAVILYKLLSERVNSPKRAVGYLAATLIITFTIGGWFYLRNWIKFGTPFVVPWEGRMGFDWWQDPGFHTAPYFLRFGTVFTYPYFSAFCSFLDSLYATFWGDGLCAGMSYYLARPPWNYDYISCTYLLAVPATIIIIIGLLSSAKKSVTHAAKPNLLILGVVLAVTYTLFNLNLRVPHQGLAKAFYCLGLLLPISILFAQGIDAILTILTERKKLIFKFLFWAWFGTLAAAILLSFFVCTGHPQQQFHRARHLVTNGKLQESVKYFEAALAAEPTHSLAHNEFGVTLAHLGQLTKAEQHCSQAVRLDPDNPTARYNFAVVLSQMSRFDEAIKQLQQALKTEPRDIQTNLLLAKVLTEKAKFSEAADQYRRVLQIEPDNSYAVQELKTLEKQKPN